LSDAELQVCREDFVHQPLDVENRNAPLSEVSRRTHEMVERRVREVLALVASGTNLRVDLPLGGSYFAPARFTMAPHHKPWHQHHASFFSTQNPYDYLNFYIVIKKARRDRSNLCIVPFDVLEKESPRTFRRVVRGGAARYVRVRGRTLVYFDDTGS